MTPPAPRAAGELRRAVLEDGVEIAYRDEGAGQPLLLIHGITEDHRSWDALAPRLAERARVVRIDLPGHGASSALREYSAGTLTDAVARFVAALGLESPRVIGHSLGAVVATLLGAFTPLRSVVSIDQPLRLGPFLEMIRRIAPRLAGRDFVAAMNEELELIAGPGLPEWLRAELRAYRVVERRPVVLGIWLPLVDQTEQRIAETLAPLFARLTAPYLSLHGPDPGPGYAEWLRERIAGARVEIWPEHGHWLHRVDPERFLARVREFHAQT